jgi:flagellar biosynthesis protein FlhA
MNPTFLAFFTRLDSKAVSAPLIIVLLLAMLVLPLPAFALDLLFTFNIAISIMVLMIGLQTTKPLDFISFPTILLITTLLRLSLNVASTRVVLAEGHTGPGAAGKVIEAFGHFLIGGNYTVGIVIFVILTIINFMVVTKGAGRIAEVGARFTLDAMPGKQMSIDADLNSGLINQEEARKRRQEVSQESEFYGAMDGASKYVRGDAIAGIIITIINIVGGILVGMLQHDLNFSTAAKTYTLLAIGDGLVAQIPSLIISVAAGVVVSRVANNQDIGTQVTGQLFKNPKVLFMTGGIVGAMGVIPGMPNIAFLGFAGLVIGLGYLLTQQAKKAAEEQLHETKQVQEDDTSEASWKDVQGVDTVSIEVGYRLIPLVDMNRDGDLLKKIKGLRKKFAQTVGFVPPSIHITDNLELKPAEYVIKVRGVELGRGESQYGSFLAINPGMVTGNPEGVPTKDPAFGLPAVWINTEQRDQAQGMGYTVVDASTVIATHLNHILGLHASELLGRQEVQQLLDLLATRSPKLVEDFVPKVIGIGPLQKILENLLLESVPIQDMRTIVEAISEYAPVIQDTDVLTEKVRLKLSRSIAQSLFPESQEMAVITLEQNLERILTQTLLQNSNGTGIEPGLAQTLANQAEQATTKQEQLGHSPVLIVPAGIRMALARFLRRVTPNLRVLSHDELPSTRSIRVTHLIGNSA